MLGKENNKIINQVIKKLKLKNIKNVKILKNNGIVELEKELKFFDLLGNYYKSISFDEFSIYGNLIIIELDGKYSVYNLEGKKILDNEYYQVFYYIKEKLLLLQDIPEEIENKNSIYVNYHLGIFDLETKNMLVPLEFNKIIVYPNNIFVVQDYKGKYGVCYNQKLIVPTQCLKKEDILIEFNLNIVYYKIKNKKLKVKLN